MEYEYKLLSINWAGNYDSIQAQLNAAGQDGWQAVDFRWHEGSHDWVVATMMREVSAPAEKYPGPVANRAAVQVGPPIRTDASLAPVDTTDL
jgi:hypothetical protein